MEIGRGNTAGLMRLRQMAGVMTAVGLAILMVAFLVAVPVGPANADEPNITGGYSCGIARTFIQFTASGTDGVATADQSVRVDLELADGQVIEISRGEFNDANGYSFTGAYRVEVGDEDQDGHLVVTTEQGFTDGTGIGATDQTADFFIPFCKDGTTSTGATTTTIPTTTTLPSGTDAVASGVCELVNGQPTYPIDVTVNGSEGATGTVTVNGTDIPYTIDADGSVTVMTTGQAGDNPVVVTDDVAGVLLDTTLTLEDCSEPTTTTTAPPSADDASVTGVCEVVNGAPTYPIDVVINGDEGASGTVTVNGTDIPYTIGASGTVTISTTGNAGANTVVVTDDAAGVILDTTLTLEDCTPGTTTTTQPTTTTTTLPPSAGSADASGVCELIGGAPSYPIDVTVSGDEGATGTVTVNGDAIPYTIDADGEVTVMVEGTEGDNTVVVTDDVAGVILDTTLTLEDCSEPTTTTTEPPTTTTTTQPPTTTTTTLPPAVAVGVDGVCEVVNGEPVYTIDIEVTGDPGATGVINVNGTDTPYTVGSDGTVTVTVDGQEGSNTVVVTDDEVGLLIDTTVELEDCTTGDTSPTTGATTTTLATTTTAGDTSGGGGNTSPSVSVLPQQIDQETLPDTGIADGELALVGMFLVIAGAGVLVVTNRRMESEGR